MKKKDKKKSNGSDAQMMVHHANKLTQINNYSPLKQFATNNREKEGEKKLILEDNIKRLVNVLTNEELLFILLIMVLHLQAVVVFVAV